MAARSLLLPFSMQLDVTSLSDLIGMLLSGGLLSRQAVERSIDQPEPNLGAGVFPPWVASGNREELPPIDLDSLRQSPRRRDREPEREGVGAEEPASPVPIEDSPGHEPLEHPEEVSIDSLLNSPIGRELGEGGIEALAWYVPFHSSLKDHGIYFRESGLLFLADYLKTSGISPNYVQHSYALLDSHEAIHGRDRKSTRLNSRH